MPLTPIQQTLYSTKKLVSKGKYVHIAPSKLGSTSASSAYTSSVDSLLKKIPGRG
jgi:hypothetical protein